MSARRLTDAELRQAAARRPGYATYPEYRPGQRERLGRLPAATPAAPWCDCGLSLAVPRGSALHRPHCARSGAAPRPERTPAVPAITPVVIRPPMPDPPATVTLTALPAAPVFDFQPRLITARPLWRRRWHWGVLATSGRTEFGYAWTEAGARRRTARASRRAAR